MARSVIPTGRMHYVVPTQEGRETIGRLKDVRFVPGIGPLTLFEPPQSGELYVAALDPCHGVPGGNSAAICVLAVRRCRQVAEWYENTSPVDAVDILCALGQYYNWAMINAEVNIAGHSIIKRAGERIYPNKYKWPKWDEAGYTHKLFWETNKRSRSELFATMARWFQKKMVAIRSSALLSELSTFEKMVDNDSDDEGGGADRKTYKQKAHRPDDRTMALGIAIQTITQIPHIFSEHTPYESPYPSPADLGLQGYDRVNAGIFARAAENEKMAKELLNKHFKKPDNTLMDLSWNPIRSGIEDLAG